jgi:hypothetical protein
MHKHNGYYYEYHDKHKAWVISRPFDQVSLTGGSHFEAQWSASEQELLNALDKREARDD